METIIDNIEVFWYVFIKFKS